MPPKKKPKKVPTSRGVGLPPKQRHKIILEDNEEDESVDKCVDSDDVHEDSEQEDVVDKFNKKLRQVQGKQLAQVKQLSLEKPPRGKSPLASQNVTVNVVDEGPKTGENSAKRVVGEVVNVPDNTVDNAATRGACDVPGSKTGGKKTAKKSANPTKALPELPQSDMEDEHEDGDNPATRVACGGPGTNTVDNAATRGACGFSGPGTKTGGKKTAKKSANHTLAMPDLPRSDLEDEDEDGDSQNDFLDIQDDHGQDEDDDEDDEQSQSVKKKLKKKKKFTVVLTDEQEEMIVNWIKDNPMIYDKGKGNYKKKADKRIMWALKAKEVGLTPEQLTTWYESNRTRYGKLINKKSGQATKNLTDRQEWVIKSFDFLRNHIHRQPSRAGVAVSTIILFLQLKNKVK